MYVDACGAPVGKNASHDTFMVGLWVGGTSEHDSRNRNLPADAPGCLWYVQHRKIENVVNCVHYIIDCNYRYDCCCDFFLLDSSFNVFSKIIPFKQTQNTETNRSKLFNYTVSCIDFILYIFIGFILRLDKFIALAV